MRWSRGGGDYILACLVWRRVWIGWFEWLGSRRCVRVFCEEISGASCSALLKLCCGYTSGICNGETLR